MQILKKVDEIIREISLKKNLGKRIGFVPTMGALHEGHLRLIDKCLEMSNVCICSIFINPLQFNNKEDYRLYPSTLEQDAKFLKERGCTYLFHPSVDEMYPEKVTESYHFGALEYVMEGKFRPGHFNGVGVVVKRLFDIVQPDLAFFGEKDYQQLLVVQSLVEQTGLTVKIIPCPIVREEDGLAMSSRNMRLSATDRLLAPFIYQVLKEVPHKAQSLNPKDLCEDVQKLFKEQSAFRLEYFEVADACTLELIDQWRDGQEVVACVAAYLGEIRLIDNIRFIS